MSETESDTGPAINQPKRSRWKRRALIAFVLLLPAWYALSTGPYAGLRRALPRPIAVGMSRAWNDIYYPLALLADWSPGFADFLRWWVGLWA